jgi:hypothetical protein
MLTPGTRPAFFFAFHLYVTTVYVTLPRVRELVR